MKATIGKCGHELVAYDEKGHCIVTSNPYLNPSALRQLILAVEMEGFTIDWINSSVAKPEEVAP